jgi:hypothetical protein
MIQLGGITVGDSSADAAPTADSTIVTADTTIVTADAS